jgi:hypothetical protein
MPPGSFALLAALAGAARRGGSCAALGPLLAHAGCSQRAGAADDETTPAGTAGIMPRPARVALCSCRRPACRARGAGAPGVAALARLTGGGSSSGRGQSRRPGLARRPRRSDSARRALVPSTRCRHVSAWLARAGSWRARL